MYSQSGSAVWDRGRLIYLLNGMLDDVAYDRRILLLSDTHSSANCLIFYSGIPLRLKDMDAARGGQVEPAVPMKLEIETEERSSTHPRAPVPRVISRTVMSGLFVNASRATPRSAGATDPSILTKLRLAFRHMSAAISSVFLKNEKTMLKALLSPDINRRIVGLGTHLFSAS